MDNHPAAGKSPHLLSSLIFALALLIYVNTFDHGFVFDDEAVLVKNEFVQSGLGGLKEIFTTGSWDGFEPEAEMHIYRPLQLTALALQYEFFGLNPMGYHVAHVLSYALLCMLIFRLLDAVFANNANGRLIAFTAAILYTVHPVHTEVVANIKGNGDLIALLIGTASLICIWNYSQKKSLQQLALASLLFLLALLTKETIVCLVGVAALMLYFFSKNSIKQIIIALLPMLAMVVIYLGLRSLVFGDDAQKLTETTEFDNFVYMADGLSQELGLRLYALGKNLQLCLAPYPLQFMYVYDSVPMVEFWDIRSTFSLATYALLGLAFILNCKKNNIWGFAIGFFFVALALFSNTVFSIPNILSERWLLMPSLATSIAIAYALTLLSEINYKSALCLFLLLMIGYSGYTIERNTAWKSNLTLMEADIQTAPRNAMANRFLAILHLAEASTAKEPEEHLRKAAYYQGKLVELAPNDAAKHHMLGEIYEKLGEHRKAAEVFEKVAEFVSPLQQGAEFLYAKNCNAGGLYQDALPIWTALKERDPESVDIVVGHTVALLKTGQEEAAEANFRNLLELVNKPQNGNTPHIALNNLGIQFEEMGAHELAASAFGLAASYESPIQGKAAFSRAKNLNLAKLFTEAVPLWEDLDRKYPGVIDVKLGRATALIVANQKEAVLQTVQSLQALLQQQTGKALSNQNLLTLNSIAVSLQNWGQHALAAELFGRASQTDSPIQGKAMFSQANNLNLAQNYEQALSVWLELEKAYSSVVEVQIGKAEALAGLKQTEEAIRAYEEAIALIRSDPSEKRNSSLMGKARESIDRLQAQ